ncbi:MAG: hypothetical protein AAGU74_08295 [Bacillota bacterium]
MITDIIAAIAPLNLPIAVGMYETTDDYPEKYIVITPLEERNDDIADDAPLTETEAADVNLYCRGDYQATKSSMKDLLETAGFYFADRRYVMYETDTKHHHYVFTIEKKEVL